MEILIELGHVLHHVDSVNMNGVASQGSLPGWDVILFEKVENLLLRLLDCYIRAKGLLIQAACLVSPSVSELLLSTPFVHPVQDVLIGMNDYLWSLNDVLQLEISQSAGDFDDLIFEVV